MNTARNVNAVYTRPATAARSNMGVVFMETLRRGWRGMVYWGLGVGALAFLVIIVVPNVESLRQMSTLLESLPAFLVQGFAGGQDIAFMSTPEGYLAWRFFSFALLFLAVYAVLNGLNAFSSDEENGILDGVLALPLPRWRLIVEKSLAYALLMLGVVTITFLLIVAATAATPSIIYDLGKVGAATFTMLPSMLLIMAVTVAASALFRRGAAIAISAGFVIGSYFLDFLGAAAPDSPLGSLRALSFFRYYDVTGVVQHGIAWGNVALLIIIALVLFGIAVTAFQRRDVGV